MSDFRTILMEEESSLKTKLENLYDFIESERFDELDEVQKSLMRVQLEAMRTYWRCLITRVNVYDEMFKML